MKNILAKAKQRTAPASAFSSLQDVGAPEGVIDPEAVLTMDQLNKAATQSSFIAPQMAQLPTNFVGDDEFLDPVDGSSGIQAYQQMDGEIGAGNSYFNRIAGIESSDNYGALNKGSGAYGKFQIMPETQKEWAGKLGMTIKEARTPAGQERVIRGITSQNARTLEKAGMPVNDFTLYMLHQQGATGGMNMLKGDFSKVKDINIASNLPGGGSKEDFMAYWSNKLR